MIFNNKKESEYSNVINSGKLVKEAEKTLKFESNAFAKTLGPYGMNTIIEDQYLQHQITKDGYTVYRSMVVYNRIGRVFARLIQKISSSLNETVGDGTTSAVIVANELYKLKKIIKRYGITPKILSDILKSLTGYICKLIKDRYSVDISYDIMNEISNRKGKEYLEQMEEMRNSFAWRIIRDLSAISLNNDYKSAELVADMFMTFNDPLNGFINVEISTTNRTYFDHDRGFEVFHPMILPEMVNQNDNRTGILDDPMVLVVKGELAMVDWPAIKNLMDYVMGREKKPLLVMAGGYSRPIEDNIRASILAYAEKYRAMLPLICVELDTNSINGNNTVNDIVANVGAELITVGPGKNFPFEQDPSNYVKYLGRCEKVISKTTSVTRIIRGQQNGPKIAKRVADIDAELEKMKSEPHIDHYDEIRKLNKRKALLLNDMITLYVGGDTVEEKQSKADLFDDAVRGCRSALRNGVVCGGNTVVARICNNILNLNKTDSKAYQQVCDNIRSEIGYSDIVSDKKFNKLVTAILKGVRSAYVNSYAMVLNNKFGNKLKSWNISNKCIKNHNIYNLITSQYESVWDPTITEEYEESSKNMSIFKGTKVINSAETDKQILLASTSIVDLLITSNQFIRVPETQQMRKNM